MATSTEGTKVSLYGVKVSAADYERLKKIADALFGYTPSGLPVREMKRWCVQMAVEAMERAKNL